MQLVEGLHDCSIGVCSILYYIIYKGCYKCAHKECYKCNKRNTPRLACIGSGTYLTFPGSLILSFQLIHRFTQAGAILITPSSNFFGNICNYPSKVHPQKEVGCLCAAAA